MIDETVIKLMAKIMQDGMTGNRIADLFNDANKRFNLYERIISPPWKTQEKKESYAQKLLVELKDEGRQDALNYIANQLLDKNRIYFEKDSDHPYPQELLNLLKEKVTTTEEIKNKQKIKKELTHGKTIRTLLKVIENKELADLLYKDIKDIDLCILVGAWKPALVLCGSALEAILSDWLDTVGLEDIQKTFQKLYPHKVFNTITDLTLEQLINISEKVGLLHGYHATLSDGIRNFRNLIHPKYSIRHQIKPNKAIAEIGKQIIFAILQERQKLK